MSLEGEDFSAAWSVVRKSAVLCISDSLQLAVLRFTLLWGGAGWSGPLVPLKSSHIVGVAALCRMYFTPNLCFLGQVMFLLHPFLASCLTPFWSFNIKCPSAYVAFVPLSKPAGLGISL